MGDAMEEGTVVRWLKKQGEKVSEQEEYVEIATEKANITVPSTENGVLSEIYVQEGETVAVGTPIAFLDTGNGAAPPRAGRELPIPSGAPSPAAPTADLSAPAPAPAAPVPPASEPAAGGRVKASPLARKVAAEHGVDLSGLQGSGPGGRIIEADVSEVVSRGGAPAPAAAPAAPATPAPAPVAAPPSAPVAGTDRPMSQMRKVIARRLSYSKQTIPHFYLTIDVDMRAAAKLRAEYNGAVPEDRKVSFNDLVVRACALALEGHPAVNSRLEGDNIRQPDAVNIGIAVSLEEGLIVPVVRDANKKGLSTIARDVRDLAGRARKNQLKPDEFAGGTFTVSNLGMYDITQFQAIINAPEAAILAVGAIREVPVVQEGAIVPGKQMYLTISVDHRLVDGQAGAKFMQEVKRLLETPLSLFG